MHTTIGHRRAFATLAATGMLLVTACSDGGEQVTAQARSAPRGEVTAGTDAPEQATTTTLATATPAAALREAVRRTAEQPTYRMHMLMTADGEPMMDMTSITSADGRFQEATMDIEPFGEVTMLIVDGASYFRFPTGADGSIMPGGPGLPPGKEWVHLDAAGMTGMTGMDPSALNDQSANVLAALERISDDVELVGTEDVEGVPSDHYRYTIDVESIMEDTLSSGLFSDEVDGSADMFGDETQMDIWVGPDGLIRRVSYELSVVGVPGVSSFTYEMTLTDHGVPVEVTAPLPEATISMDEFMMGMMAEGS